MRGQFANCVAFVVGRLLLISQQLQDFEKTDSIVDVLSPWRSPTSRSIEDIVACRETVVVSSMQLILKKICFSYLTIFS